jgi:rSAM/selenodomain-associated transferase 1
VRQVTGVHDEHGPGQDVLYVAARAPRPGLTKSRLGRTIGHERAAALYAAFVRDLAERLNKATCRVGWYVTPEDAWTELAALVAYDRAPTVQRGPILVQPPADWTERQRALFATARARHERRTILIASDSPQLGVDLIGEAFQRLQRDDLVLGPTEDGGYYLIGVRTDGHATAAHPWDALCGVRMSTGTVLDEILARVAGLGLRASLLPTTFDVDEAADLDQLIPLALIRDDLVATRTALEALGLIPVLSGAAERTPHAPVAVGGAR